MDRELERERNVGPRSASWIPRTLPIEGRIRQLKHDAGVQDQFDARRRQIEAQGGRIIAVRSELELKRSIGKDISDYAARTGSWPHGDHLEKIARDHGTGVVDGHIKIPDTQIEYETSGGEKMTENQDFKSGRGMRLTRKIALGFKIGGLKVRQALGIKPSRAVKNSLGSSGKPCRSKTKKKSPHRSILGDSRLGRGRSTIEPPWFDL
jgi:hypothetical protein